MQMEPMFGNEKRDIKKATLFPSVSAPLATRSICIFSRHYRLLKKKVYLPVAAKRAPLLELNSFWLTVFSLCSIA